MGLSINTSGPIFLSTPYEKDPGENNWDLHTVSLTFSEPVVQDISGWDSVAKKFTRSTQWSALAGLDGVGLLLIDDVAVEHFGCSLDIRYEPATVRVGDINVMANFPVSDLGTFDSGMYDAAVSSDGFHWVSTTGTSGSVKHVEGSNAFSCPASGAQAVALPGYTGSGPNGLAYSYDGTKLYALEHTLDNPGLLQIPLSTPGDVTTASAPSKKDVSLRTLSGDLLSNQGTSSLNITVSTDGRYLYVCENTNWIYQFAFGTKGEIDTLTFVGRLDTTSQSPNVRHIHVAPDNRRFIALYFNTSWKVGLFEFDDPDDISSGFTALNIGHGVGGETSPYAITGSPDGKYIQICGTQEDHFTHLIHSGYPWDSNFEYYLDGTVPTIISEIYRDMQIPTLKVAVADVLGNLNHTTAPTIATASVPALFTRSGGVATKVVDYTPTVIDAGAIQFKLESTGTTHIERLDIELNIGA